MEIMEKVEKRLVCPLRMANYGNVVDVENECIEEKCAWWAGRYCAPGRQ